MTANEGKLVNRQVTCEAGGSCNHWLGPCGCTYPGVIALKGQTNSCSRYEMSVAFLNRDLRTKLDKLAEKRKKTK